MTLYDGLVLLFAAGYLVGPWLVLGVIGAVIGRVLYDIFDNAMGH